MSFHQRSGFIRDTHQLTPKFFCVICLSWLIIYLRCGQYSHFVNVLVGSILRKKSKTMVHGIFWKKGRGLPNFIVQEDYKKDRKSDIMRGETKAAVLEGGVLCTFIFWRSFCMTLIGFIFSMAADKLVCKINEKEIYDKSTKKKVKLQLYHAELQIFITIT